MCLILHREAGKRVSNVPERVLDHNRYANPDGFGIAWRGLKGLQYEKFGAGPEQYAAFKKLVQTIDATEFEYVAHFRKATHGPVCQELSHPFAYDDPRVGQVLVFHNGIIDIKPGEGESDTSEFVKTVLANMQSQWWKKPAYRFLVEQSVGWSRLLIMTKNETVRMKANDWKNKDGIHYSCEPLPGGYSGKGYTAAYSYGLTDDDEDDQDEFDYMQGVGMAVKTGEKESKGWMHMGHWVRRETTETDKDTQDTWGRVLCLKCHVLGEYYNVDGVNYTDVNHSTGDAMTSGDTIVVTIDERSKNTLADIVERDKKLLTDGVVKSAKESADYLLPQTTEKVSRRQRRRNKNRERVQIQL